MAKRAEDIPWARLDKQKFFVSSAAFFMGVRATLYPILLVKTRLQVQDVPALGGTASNAAQPQYSSTRNAFKTILRVEGIRGLYKGFLTTCVGILPGQFLYIGSYELIRANVQRLLPNLSSGSVASEWVRNGLGGGGATLCSSIVSVPLDVVSQRLMIQDGLVHKKVYRGGLDAVSQIVRSEGIRGLYRGYFSFILCYVPTSGIWWGSYQTVRGTLARACERVEEENGFVSNLLKKANPAVVDVAIQTVGGGCAGAIAATITNPLDVAKTQIQVLTKETSGSSIAPTSRNPFTVLVKLVQREGFRGLMRGAFARVLNMAPSSMFMVVAYETVKRISLKEEVQ